MLVIVIACSHKICKASARSFNQTTHAKPRGTKAFKLSRILLNLSNVDKRAALPSFLATDRLSLTLQVICRYLLRVSFDFK